MRVRATGAIALAQHAVAAELEPADDRERGDAGLGRAVVGLARVAEHTRRRRRVDDAPVDRRAGLRLVAPVRGGVTRRRERTLQVHRDHRVPLRLFHVGEHAVAEDAGVVDDACRAGRTCRSPAAPCGPRPRSRRRSRRRRPLRRPSPLISSTTSIAGLSDPPSPCMSPPRSFTTTLAPSAAYASACSRPIPRPDPVTMTTRPSQIPMLVPYWFGAARAADACRACRCRAGAAPR